MNVQLSVQRALREDLAAAGAHDEFGDQGLVEILLTKREYAAHKRVTPRTADDWVARKLIICERTPGGRRRFRVSMTRRELTVIREAIAAENLARRQKRGCVLRPADQPRAA